MISNVIAFAGSLASIIAFALVIGSPSMGKMRRMIVIILFVFLLAAFIAPVIYNKYYKDFYGEYEWQWAGENWLGYVTIFKNKEGEDAATIDVRYIGKDKKLSQQSIIRSISEGKMIPFESGFKLVLPVNKKLNNENNRERVFNQMLVS